MNFSSIKHSRHSKSPVAGFTCRGVVALTVFMALLPTARALGEDWPQWRGPRSDGSWQGPKLPDVWPTDGLSVRWRQNIGGGYAGVVVADGRVFVMDRQAKPAELERIRCFDATNGKPLWTHSYLVVYGDLDHGNGPRAAPTVADGRVYTLGAVGHCWCLDAETGQPLWSHDFVRDHDANVPEWGLAASPVIWKELVIVHPGAQPGGCLVALDRTTGKEVWRASTDPAGYCTPVVIHHEGRPRLIAWTPKNVLGLDPDCGKIHWSVPYKVTYGVSIATPIFHRGTVLVTGYWEGTKAIRLGEDLEDAELIWEENRYLRGLMSQPLCRGEHVYSIDKKHGLTCFELATGQKVWDDDNQMTPAGRNPHAALIWINDEDRVIILNSDGDLILARFRPEGYVEQSRTNIIGPTWAHPAYAGSCVFARNDEDLVCVSLIEPAGK